MALRERLKDRRVRRLLLTTMVVVLLAATKPPGHERDLTSYYTAGLLLREGAPEQAFATQDINRRYQELHPGPRRTGAFLYSPLYLAPAAALSLLPFGEAELANHLLTLAALGLLLFVLLGYSSSWRFEALLCLVFLLSHPVAVQFRYQNWSCLLALLVTAGWRPGHRGQIWSSATLLALAIHLKAFVVLLLFPLAFVGGRRLVAATLALVVALAAITLPWVGADSYRAYAGSMVKRSAAGVTPFYNKVSLQATAARFFTPPHEWFKPRSAVTHPLVRWLFWLSLPLLVAAVLWLRREPDRAVALTVPYLLLFVPQVWDHTWLLALSVWPLMPNAARAGLGLALCASAAYGPIIPRLAVEVVRGAAASAPLQAVLLFYPILGLFAAASLLAGRSSPPAART